MKNLFLLLIMISFNCKTLNNEKANKSRITLYAYVIDNQIKIKFVNVGDDEISLYTPCLTNTLIYISKDNIEVSPKVLIRRNCDAKIFILGNNENQEFYYPRKIDEQYTLEKGQEYNLKIVYSIFDKGKVQDKIISKEYSFIY